MKKNLPCFCLCFLFLISILSFSQNGFSADWSTTELQYQLGDIQAPSFAGGGSDLTHIATLQHASGWKYGDHFFFIDFTHSGNTNFNDDAAYAEYYANFSLNKLRNQEMWTGLIKDLGLLAGINWSTEAKSIKYLPGIRLSFNLPGFDFANLDINAYLDGSRGVAHNGAPKEDHSFVIDFNWGLPFSLGNQDFSIEGHAQFIGSRDDNFGNTSKWNILTQPQFRYDLGKVLGQAGLLYVGVELQIWFNKLGDDRTDEFVPQALVAWRF